MNPVNTTLCTHVLRPPSGVPESECGVLPIRRTNDPDTGIDAVTSYWRPSVAELDLLRHGGLLVFTCQGKTHPPVLLEVDEPADPRHIIEQYEEDHRIIERINAAFIHSVADGPEPPDLTGLLDVPLSRMLEAAERIRRENHLADKNADGETRLTAVPNDRLIAALYTLLHYHPHEAESLPKPILHHGPLALAITPATHNPSTDH